MGGVAYYGLGCILWVEVRWPAGGPSRGLPPSTPTRPHLFLTSPSPLSLTFTPNSPLSLTQGDTKYMAPELLNSLDRYPSADIFSLGLTLYEVCIASEHCDLVRP